MENDILDSIDDLGYSESVTEDDLDEITKDGPPELKFTKLVSWYDVLICSNVFRCVLASL